MDHGSPVDEGTPAKPVESRLDTPTDLEQLEELLATGIRINASEYVELIRRIGRLDPAWLVELEPRIYSFGLQQAFSDGDEAGIVEVAEAGGQVLDAIGLHGEAIARMNQAMMLVPFDSVSRVRLKSSLLGFEALSGCPDHVRSQLTVDAELDPTSSSAEVATSVALASCLVLGIADMDPLIEAAARARSLLHDRFASGLTVQLVSALAARGETDESRGAAKDLLSYANGVGHRAREVDAEVALIALQARLRRSEEPQGLGDEAEQLLNNQALWKLLLSLFRQRSLRREEPAAQELHLRLLKHYDWMNPGYRHSFAGLERFSAALLDAKEVVLPVPDASTLLSLPNILASAEAVAMGGTLSAAADWLAWLEEELPDFVVTSLEWPACRARVEALLLLRVGQQAAAVERLGQSIACCEERGDTIEAEIGRSQLAAIVLDEELAEVARERLEAVGIEAALFASAATRASERAAMAGEAALTVLEARVLGRVARGMTHREIEAEMGLRPRGASRPITTGYAKLGVKGRVQAAQVARDRQIA